MSGAGAGPANSPMSQWDTGVQSDHVAGLALFGAKEHPWGLDRAAGPAK
jgi:hypothetical protein